jgi:hypothetical protein
MRTLVLDIETGPNLAYVWGLWDQNVGLSQIAEVSSVLCFAAKWLNEKQVRYHSVHHDGRDTMVRAAWDLLDQADAVVHYNGRAFDIKHLNREFVLAGLGPPSPHKDIDLLTTSRGRFRFASNKLEHVASQLGLGRKVKHSGFELWKACLDGDPAAWATMRRYNIGDVRLTESLYWELLPWIRAHPNVNLFNDGQHLSACPFCACTDLERRGVAATTVGQYQRYRCTRCKGRRGSLTPPQSAAPSDRAAGMFADVRWWVRLTVTRLIDRAVNAWLTRKR